MGKETVLLKTEEKMSRADLADFMEALVTKIRAGEVILRQGDEELTLTLPSRLVLEVKVEDEEKGRKGIKHSLELELEWYDDDDSASLELG